MSCALRVCAYIPDIKPILIQFAERDSHQSVQGNGVFNFYAILDRYSRFLYRPAFALSVSRRMKFVLGLGTSIILTIEISKQIV